MYDRNQHQEKFEDITRVIMQKQYIDEGERQYNGQKKKKKRQTTMYTTMY